MFTNDEPKEERRFPRKVTKKEGDEEGDNVRLKLPKILTYDEIDRALLVINEIEDLVAFRVMLYGGLRVAEATSLKVRDLHPDTQSIFVDQGKGGKDRYVPIDIATLAIANCYIKAVDLKPEDTLFKSTKRTLQRHVEEIYIRAGIIWGKDPLGKPIVPGCHTLRHTCATWQLDKGIPLEVVRANLGHTDIAITQIYTHLNIRQRSRTYQDCSRFGV